MPFRFRLLGPLALGAALLFSACDSSDPDPDPIEPSPFCERAENANTLACAVQAGEVRYDTLGTEIQIRDAGNGVAPRVNEVTWSSEYTYILDGRVFVNDGQTLTIEPGTLIRAEGGQGLAASAFIVARGGRVLAEGTAEAPIIFTSESDPLDGSLGTQGGLWGGVVLLGSSSTNTVPGTVAIEGIPTSEERGIYGCGDSFSCNEADDSGVLRYVSIRYGGAVIGANNELNGLTMGGVGTGTTIEYVEVFANLDDAFEWFGGTVDGKYLVAAFTGDDHFDYDEGWRGRGQFWFGLNGPNDGNQLGEHDGGTTPEDGTPYAIPTIYNATYIGSGPTSSNIDSNGILFRDNAGGKYYNSIFMEARGYAVNIEDLASGQDSRARLEAGDLALASNLFFNFGVGNNPSDLFIGSGSANSGNQWVVDYMTASAQNNLIADPLLRGVSRSANGQLDPRPGPGSPAATMTLFPYTDSFFTSVNYAGAVDPNGTNWMKGWTALDQYGFLAD